MNYNANCLTLWKYEDISVKVTGNKFSDSRLATEETDHYYSPVCLRQPKPTVHSYHPLLIPPPSPRSKNTAALCRCVFFFFITHWPLILVDAERVRTCVSFGALPGVSVPPRWLDKQKKSSVFFCSISRGRRFAAARRCQRGREQSDGAAAWSSQLSGLHLPRI